MIEEKMMTKIFRNRVVDAGAPNERTLPKKLSLAEVGVQLLSGIPMAQAATVTFDRTLISFRATSRRIIGLAAAVLTFCFFGGLQPANAAAFLAINGGTWSYSAATAGGTLGQAYYWGLSNGIGSVSYAYAYYYNGGNRAAAYAVARAGFGWAGAWAAQGITDPYAGISIDVPLSPDGPGLYSQLSSATSSSNLANTLQTDANNEITAADNLSPALPGGAGSYPTSPDYNVNTDGSGNITGVTFNSGITSDSLNAGDKLDLLVVNSNALSNFCSAIGDSGCSTVSAQTNKSGEVTDISSMMSDFGNSVVFSDLVDPSTLSSGGTVNFGTLANTSGDQVLLVQEASPVPLPASILLFGPGLLALGLLAARRCQYF
ncbi:MAG: hypothetical protein ACYC9H_13870 [Sulfuricaulis sp.]